MKKMLSVLAVVALVVPSAQVVAMQRMRSAGAAAKARMQQARESAAKNAKKLSEWTGSLMADVGRAIKKQDFKKIPDIMKRHKKKAAGIIGAGVVLAAVYGLSKLMTPPDFGEIVIGEVVTPDQEIAALREVARVAAEKEAAKWRLQPDPEAVRRKALHEAQQAQRANYADAQAARQAILRDRGDLTAQRTIAEAKAARAAAEASEGDEDDIDE